MIMSVSELITLFSLCILSFVAIGGWISSKYTVKGTFFSINQTNWLRSIAILMVMFSHYYPIVGLTYDDGPLSFCMNFGYMGVAIFFLLSGYSIMISKIKKPNYLIGFLPKRLLRLYIPFLIVFVLNAIIVIAMGGKLTIKDFLMIPLMSLPSTLNWYLKIQLCLYIVFYLMARIFKKNNTILLMTFIICAIYMIIGYFTNITPFWYESIFAFPLGMFLANNKEKIYSLISKRYIIALPASIVLFLVCLIPYYFKGGTIFEIVYIFGLLQLIVCFCVKFGGSVSNKVFTYLGVISLELYLTHIVLINTVISNLNISGYNLYINILILLGFIILSVILSLFVKAISSMIVKRINIKFFNRRTPGL